MSIPRAKDGIAWQYDLAHALGESGGPTLGTFRIVIDELMRDGFRLHERMGHNATVEIIAGANTEGAGLLRKQRVIGNEEDRAAVVARAIMTSLKIVALEPGNGSGIGVKHDFLVRSQTASQLRKVNHDDAADPSGRGHP